MLVNNNGLFKYDMAMFPLDLLYYFLLLFYYSDVQISIIKIKDD